MALGETSVTLCLLLFFASCSANPPQCSGTGKLPTNLSFVVPVPISKAVAILVSSIPTLPCLHQKQVTNGEPIFTCFEDIYEKCLLSRAESNCAIELSHGIGEICFALVYDYMYEQFNTSSTCIHAFLEYTATLTNNTSFYIRIFSIAVQSYLRSCLESNSTNKQDICNCVVNSITSCLEQRKRKMISVGTCFTVPYNVCSMVKEVDPCNCALFVDNIIDDYSKDLCTNRTNVCRNYMSDLRNASIAGDIMGYPGKLGLTIQRRLRNHQDTKETLVDYMEAVAFLRNQNSADQLYNNFNNDGARAFMNVTDMFMERSRINDLRLLQANTSATMGPSSIILESLEDLSKILARSVLSRQGQVEQNFTYTGSNLRFDMRAISRQSQNYSYQAGSDNGTVLITIPTAAVCSVDDNVTSESPSNSNSCYMKRYRPVFKEGCEVMIASSVSFNLDSLFESAPNSTGRIISPIFSSQLVASTSNADIMEDQITILEENAIMKVILNESVKGNASCVFWNRTTQSWSTNGVTTNLISCNEVECTSSHLTSFAILVDHAGLIDENSTAVTEDEEIALSVLGYAGPCVSIVCLILTITLLLMFRKKMNKGPLLYIHLNLSIALLLALLVFVGGIESAKMIKWLCGVIAGLLHYLFLCVFCWMLSEGIMLYLLLVKVFGRLADKWYFFLPFGWGFPILIVIISAGARAESYGTAIACWLSSQYGMRWSMVGPMIAIILANTVFLVLAIVHIIKGRKEGGAEQNVRTYDLIKSAVKGTIILLPLLGVTWIVGVFALDRYTTVFLWLFTLLNSLQGAAILYLHALRNEVINKWIRKQLLRAMPSRRNKKNCSTSFHSNVTNSSHLSNTISSTSA